MAEQWPQIHLCDLFKVKHGFAFRGKHFAAAGAQILLTPGNYPVSR